jgi:lysophospholipase L1-like esterase
MPSGYSSTVEAADPWCLRPGEADALLAGHPWRRFVVIGDSVAEGIGDPVPGYTDLVWCDRIAAELRAQRPDLEYHNLGVRGLKAYKVRATQLDAALALRPDLAMICAGGNDALTANYRPDDVDAQLTAMIEVFQHVGADVMTVSVFDLSRCPAVPEQFRESLSERTLMLSERTTALAHRLGTLHVDLSRHPAIDHPEMFSADGLHGNMRSHAISAAEAVRRLGAHLGRTFHPPAHDPVHAP